MVLTRLDIVKYKYTRHRERRRADMNEHTVVSWMIAGGDHRRIDAKRVRSASTRPAPVVCC
jgi:hypothetical protein